MSEITTKPKSSQELIVLDDTVLNTVLEQLSEGKTLASIKKEGILPCSLKKFYDFLNQENNKELKAKVESCRKIGIQNIVDHLLDVYQADINSETLDPNLISWIREKTKFITWIASKSTDLYSDKKIESYQIVGSSRAVKPKTILDKIDEKNVAAKNQLSSLITKNLNFDVAISQLKHEFPTATSIEKRDEWITGSNWKKSYSKEVIVVKFANDSSIMFELDYKGEKRIFRVYDVEELKMTNEQKVERLVKRVG